MTLFACNPPGALWNLQWYLRSKCLHYPDEVLGLELSNAVIDVVILVLPLDELRRLQTQIGRKVAVGFALLLGGGYVE